MRKQAADEVIKAECSCGMHTLLLPTFSRCKLSSGTLDCISLEAKPETVRED